MNHSEIGVIGTNLAIERGPHIVGIFFWMLTPRYPKCRRVVHDVHDGHLANTGRPDRRSQRTPCNRQRLVCLHPSAASHPRRCHWVDVHRVGRRVYIYTYTHIYWLVVWNILFFHILGRLIPTDELIFFRGVGIPPTGIYQYIISIVNWRYWS